MPQENYYIAHWGIKGQKWGIRRFRNYDDTLTEAGKRRYGDGGSKAIKKAEKERQRRAQILADPTKLYKHRNEFTKNEIETAMARFDTAAQLKEVARKERADRRANFERVVLGGTKEERLEKKLAKEKFKTQMVKEEAEQDKAKAGVAKDEYIAKQQKQTLKALKAAEARKKAEEERKIEKEKKDEKAARFERTAKKLKNLWEASQSLKSITDELGLTEAESGKSVFGSLGATLGFGSKKASEVPESGKSKKDDSEKKDKKEKKPKGEAKEETKTESTEAKSETTEAPAASTTEKPSNRDDVIGKAIGKSGGGRRGMVWGKKEESESVESIKGGLSGLKRWFQDRVQPGSYKDGPDVEQMPEGFDKPGSKSSKAARDEFIDIATDWAKSSYGSVPVSKIERIAEQVWRKALPGA